MSEVLVTGAAGFLGSRLVERLLARGARVTGVDCFTDYYDPEIKRDNLSAVAKHPSFRLLEWDLADKDLGGLPEVDVVYHLAAQAGVRASWGRDFSVYLKQNLLATQRLLERYLAKPPQRFVYASSSSVYGDAERLPTSEDDRPRPFSPYGVTKLAAEHLCLLYQRNHGLPAVALRFFTVYGPRQRPDMGFHRFFEAVREGRPLEIYGDGTQSRDFTFVEDILDAVEVAGERGQTGGVYNVGSDHPVTVLQVLDKIRAVTGEKVDVVFRPKVAGDAPHTASDITRARRDLGYEPRVMLDEGLAAQWQWQNTRRSRAAREAKA
ncbi:MAG TPA: NAD-dependent epimerase/dehydratase family protein [Candidatus Eisenbacteria bacterium]|nr:NAD-dependent epimerase/dehydratase family protein [Candidatus Eisenbacteria bacterium]